MTSKRARFLAGFVGGAWGFGVGLIFTALLITFSSGGNTLLFGFGLLASPIPLIFGIVFGIRGALRFSPFLLPLRLSNRTLVRAAGIAVGVPAALIAAFFLPFNPFIPPSDEALLADFTKNEAELNQIVSMIEHDKGLRCVDKTWTMPYDPKEVKVTQARLVSYRRHLKNVNTPRGFFIPNTPQTGGEIQFFYWIAGSAISSDQMKGFVYRVHPPKKTQHTLNYCYREAEVYRHIKGNWYLFYRFIPG